MRNTKIRKRKSFVQRDQQNLRNTLICLLLPAIIAGFVWLLSCVLLIGNRTLHPSVTVLLISGLSLALFGFIVSKGTSEKESLYEKEE